MLCCGSWQDLLVSLHFCGVPLEPGDQELHLGGISSPRAAVTPVLQELEVTCVSGRGMAVTAQLTPGLGCSGLCSALGVICCFRISYPKEIPRDVNGVLGTAGL